jgi:hypothetical protein
MFKSKVDEAAYVGKNLIEKVKLDILPVAGAGQEATDILRQNYQNSTPGQQIKKFKDYTKHK